MKKDELLMETLKMITVMKELVDSWDAYRLPSDEQMAAYQRVWNNFEQKVHNFRGLDIE